MQGGIVITFSNGHRFDFGCASGAMAFRGDGWWFEQPSRWAGLIRPREFTVIVKTLTFMPRRGNLRWYAPWRCVRMLLNGGMVNAVGLTNPGYQWWCEGPYRHITRRGYKAIVSFMPETVVEAAVMTERFNLLPDLVGVQLNLSCPNVARDGGVAHVCGITEAVVRRSAHPVSLKLSYTDDYTRICRELDGRVEAFELINTVPFGTVYPGRRSPLARYGLTGGVSGRPIKKYAVEALKNVRAAGVKTPIISGGGIETFEDVAERHALGAAGFVFGSVFVRRPWRPNTIIRRWRKARETAQAVGYPAVRTLQLPTGDQR
jgi:dihydroorotate dehydrogenase (NAD+) catalytic subunit